MNYLDSSVKLHSGGGILPDADFFVQPPMQIGRVVTAQTSLKQGENAATTGERLKWVAIYTLIGLVIAALIIYFFGVSYKSLWFYIWVLGFSLIGVIIGMVSTSFSHTCSYVGEQGVAKFSLSKDRYSQPRGDIFEFARANALYVEKTQHFTNGVYQNTTYKYKWVDDRGSSVYTLQGSYRNRDAEPSDENDAYYLATSAAGSWNYYKLLRFIDIINNGGFVVFNVKSLKIEMGLTTMNIYKGGDKLTWNINDIDSINISQGWVTIFNSNYNEIGWFSKLFGKGKLTFMYSEMPDANLFLLLFESLYKKPIY